MTLRRFSPIALLVLLPNLAGCYRWEPTTISPRRLLAETEPTWMRVSVHDTQPFIPFEHPLIAGDSIRGTNRASRPIAIDDINRVEVRRFEVLATIGVVLSSAAVVGLGFLGIYYLEQGRPEPR